MKSDWHLTDAQIAYSISTRVLGQVIGAFCITICADFYGRKPALISTLIILAIGSILVALSTNIFQVSIFRLITGIGIGGEVVIAAAYIGEISPKSKRGWYTSLIFLIGTIGFAASGPVSFVLLQEHGKIITMGIEDWRILMAVPGIVALLLIPLRYGMSESPRWLLSKGRIKEGYAGYSTNYQDLNIDVYKTELWKLVNGVLRLLNCDIQDLEDEIFPITTQDEDDATGFGINYTSRLNEKNNPNKKSRTFSKVFVMDSNQSS